MKIPDKDLFRQEVVAEGPAATQMAVWETAGQSRRHEKAAAAAQSWHQQWHSRQAGMPILGAECPSPKKANLSMMVGLYKPKKVKGYLLSY